MSTGERKGALDRLSAVVTGPLKLLPAAIQAVPAMKYALAAIALVGCAAVGIGYFKDPKLALIGTIVGLALMGMMVIFAQVAKLNSKVMTLPATIFVWTCLALFMIWSGAMTASVFAGWPLQISLFGSPRPSGVVLIVPDVNAVAMMTPPRSSPFTVRIGDDERPLEKEGLLIGETSDIPDGLRDEYRRLVTLGEPVHYRTKLSSVAGKIEVRYDGKACKRHDIEEGERTLWVLRFEDCT